MATQGMDGQVQRTPLTFPYIDFNLSPHHLLVPTLWKCLECQGCRTERRSSLIALGVGSMILPLHHGRLLFAGTLPPQAMGQNRGGPLCPFLCLPLRGLCGLLECPEGL